MLLTYPDVQHNMLIAPAQTRSGDSMSGLAWSPRPMGASVLPKNVREGGIQFDVASNLGWHGGPLASLRQDNEIHRIRAATRLCAAGFDASFSLEASSRNGGFMDPLVRFWHSAVIPYTDPVLGVPPDGRHDLMWKSAGETYTAGASGWRIHRAELGFRTTPVRGLAIGLVSKFPLASGNLMERGGIDTAVTAAASRAVGPWQLTWEGQNVTAGHHGDYLGGIKLARSWGSQVFHVGRMVTDRWAFGCQYEDMDAGLTFGLPYSGNKRRQMTFTIRTKLSQSNIAELSVSENVRPFRTTPYVSDVIFTLAFRQFR
ncbi:MAG: hypothetical protein ACKO14_05600 [Armatimonadota bacterium]